MQRGRLRTPPGSASGIPLEAKQHKIVSGGDVSRPLAAPPWALEPCWIGTHQSLLCQMRRWERGWQPRVWRANRKRSQDSSQWFPLASQRTALLFQTYSVLTVHIILICQLQLGGFKKNADVWGDRVPWRNGNKELKQTDPVQNSCNQAKGEVNTY